MELSRTVEISATPQAVWDVLLDFERYDRWTKWARLEGEGVSDAQVLYTLMTLTMGGSLRPIRIEGNFRIVDAPRVLEWEMFLPGIFELRAGYALTPTDAGVELRHYANFSGFFAFLAKVRFERTVLRFLEVVTRDLQLWMSKSGARTNPGPNRRQRRRQGARS